MEHHPHRQPVVSPIQPSLMCLFVCVCPHAYSVGFVYMYLEFAFQKITLKQTWSSGYNIREEYVDFCAAFAVYWLNDRRSSCHVWVEVNVLNRMKCNI